MLTCSTCLSLSYFTKHNTFWFLPCCANARISLFFFKFGYFNWRLITLQYCIGFAIHQHESATGIHVIPILNAPPTSLPVPSLWVTQCTSPNLPVSCIEPGLVIRFLYDIIHILMPFSQIIPPSPSPKESKRLVYTSVSLLQSRIQGCHYKCLKFTFHYYVYQKCMELSFNVYIDFSHDYLRIN